MHRKRIDININIKKEKKIYTSWSWKDIRFERVNNRKWILTKRSTIISKVGWPFKTISVRIMWCKLCKLGVQPVMPMTSSHSLHSTSTSLSKLFLWWRITRSRLSISSWECVDVTTAPWAPLNKNIAQERKREYKWFTFSIVPTGHLNRLRSGSRVKIMWNTSTW